MIGRCRQCGNLEFGHKEWLLWLETRQSLNFKLSSNVWSSDIWWKRGKDKNTKETVQYCDIRACAMFTLNAIVETRVSSAQKANRGTFWKPRILLWMVLSAAFCIATHFANRRSFWNTGVSHIFLCVWRVFECLLRVKKSNGNDSWKAG